MMRKWTFRANGQTFVLVKRPEEREVHVLMKVFLAKLYGPTYPNLRIEVRHATELRYKPDVLSLDGQGEALFWGECGEVSRKKLTYLCFAKWSIRPRPFEQLIEQAVRQVKRPRAAPVDFINFADDHQYEVGEQGEVTLDWSAVTYRRWE